MRIFLKSFLTTESSDLKGDYIFIMYLKTKFQFILPNNFWFGTFFPFHFFSSLMPKEKTEIWPSFLFLSYHLFVLDLGG